MNNILSIIHSLGINDTLFIQMAIFIFVYLILQSLVFKPYHRAHQKRKTATVGNNEVANQFVEKAKTIENAYQIKAREISSNNRSPNMCRVWESSTVRKSARA